jgi:CRP-like cAMP-binding protein
MPFEGLTPVVNRLLQVLPHKARHNIQNECELVELASGDILYEPGAHIRDVYFPTSSFISMVATVGQRHSTVGAIAAQMVASHTNFVVDQDDASAATDNASLEVGLIGNEGMLGIPLVLGVDSSPMRALVQGSGGAWRMQAPHFRRVLAHTPALRRGLDRYVYVLIAQLAQTAACTCFHSLEARLARWLLMTHDRAHSDCFYLTHALLADMLGVRRSGVTIAAGALQHQGLINYSRGDIHILDRKGLEQASCECYRVVTDTYDQLFS